MLTVTDLAIAQSVGVPHANLKMGRTTLWRGIRVVCDGDAVSVERVPIGPTEEIGRRRWILASQLSVVLPVRAARRRREWAGIL